MLGILFRVSYHYLEGILCNLAPGCQATTRSSTSGTSRGGLFGRLAVVATAAGAVTSTCPSSLFVKPLSSHPAWSPLVNKQFSEEVGAGALADLWFGCPSMLFGQFYGHLITENVLLSGATRVFRTRAIGDQLGGGLLDSPHTAKKKGNIEEKDPMDSPIGLPVWPHIMAKKRIRAC